MAIQSPLLKITSKSEAETQKVAAALAKTLAGGMIVALHGDLGAGKTTFVKGLAEALGVTETMTSPTFTLMNVYPVPKHPNITTLVHIDTYRLKDEHELIAIGVEDYLGEPGIVTLIEWPEKIADLLEQKKVTNVTINHLEESSRTITIA